MENQKIDIRKKLRQYRAEFDLLQKIPCTEEEKEMCLQCLKRGEPLPEGFYQDTDRLGETLPEFYTLYTPELTERELEEYLTYRKLKLLKTIKNCMLFLTALAVISLVVKLLIMWG